MSQTSKFRLTAIILTITLIIGCVVFSRAVYGAEEETSEYVTMFINDRPWHDEVRYGKVKIGGIYYVPTSFFAGVAGLEVKTDKKLGNLMLTYGRKYITFDTDTRTTAYTEDAGSFFMQTYTFRSGTLWVPVQSVALALGVHYEKTTYNGVDIIRLNNGYAAYTLDALAEMYNSPETSTSVTSKPPTTSNPPPTSESETDEPEEERLIYLTFEDVPNDNTEAILDLLEEYNVRATFFVVGENVERLPDIVRRMLVEGHSVGLHTMTADTKKFTDDPTSLISEFDEENLLLEKLYHLRTRLVRAPEGSASGRKSITIDEELGKTLSESGYIVWDWNVLVPDDTSRYTAKTAAESAINGIEEYSVSVLRFHSTAKTVEILSRVLEYISEHEMYSCTAITPASSEINLIGFYQ